MNGSNIPTMKIEHAPSPPHIKNENFTPSPSPYMDEDDIYEDAGDLDFTNANQQLWLSRIPKSLWEAWSEATEDEEIEIGTVRIEGHENDPKRISLMLHKIPQFSNHPKEYTLQPSAREMVASKRPRNAFVFSEKDMPGYKSKGSFMQEFNNSDNGPVQGRSFLYEKNLRDAKRKEAQKSGTGGKRFEPYIRKPIPKQTALAGVVTREYDILPVQNSEYAELEEQALAALKPPEEIKRSFEELTSSQRAGRTNNMYSAASAARQAQKQKEAAKDNRAARLPQDVLTDIILEKFNQYRFWGIRELKAAVNQPEQFVREILVDYAVLHKSGDANGKWELKPEFRNKPDGLAGSGSAPGGMAPDVGSDMEGLGSGMGSDLGEDDGEDFEDVNVT